MVKIKTGTYTGTASGGTISSNIEASVNIISANTVGMVVIPVLHSSGTKWSFYVIGGGSNTYNITYTYYE